MPVWKETDVVGLLNLLMCCSWHLLHPRLHLSIREPGDRTKQLAHGATKGSPRQKQHMSRGIPQGGATRSTASLRTALEASGGGDCAATSYGATWRRSVGWRRNKRGGGGQGRGGGTVRPDARLIVLMTTWSDLAIQFTDCKKRSLLEPGAKIRPRNLQAAPEFQ